MLNQAGVRGFTFEGFAELLTAIPELDKHQRRTVAKVVDRWLHRQKDA